MLDKFSLQPSHYLDLSLGEHSLAHVHVDVWASCKVKTLFVCMLSFNGFLLLVWMWTFFWSVAAQAMDEQRVVLRLECWWRERELHAAPSARSSGSGSSKVEVWLAGHPFLLSSLQLMMLLGGVVRCYHPGVLLALNVGVVREFRAPPFWFRRLLRPSWTPLQLFCFGSGGVAAVIYVYVLYVVFRSCSNGSHGWHFFTNCNSFVFFNLRLWCWMSVAFIYALLFLAVWTKCPKSWYGHANFFNTLANEISN